MKLELKNVTKKYDLDTLGVEDITFSVQDGIFGIAGEAGSGMMTILGVTGGWLDADAGEIIFDGKVMNDVEPRQRNCLLICGGKMPLWGSVERNLTYGLKKRGISGKERNRRDFQPVGSSVSIVMYSRILACLPCIRHLVFARP